MTPSAAAAPRALDHAGVDQHLGEQFAAAVMERRDPVTHPDGSRQQLLLEAVHGVDEIGEGAASRAWLRVMSSCIAADVGAGVEQEAEAAPADAVLELVGEHGAVHLSRATMLRYGSSAS